MILFIGSITTGAQTPSVFVDADQYTSKPGQIADLVGNVKIIRGVEQLTCDRATINLITNDVIAVGNVIYISPREYMRAEKMNYNFNTQKGVVTNGFIQMGQETIEGEEIHKLGNDEYEARYASYTSCINCPAAWKLSGTKINATPGAYAFIKNPVVRIYGAPVLWLPYMVIPIKTQRQSGLLPPSFAFSETDGFTLQESFFWAISPSKDLTLTETSYKNRGYKTGVEYRFLADENSGGKFNGNFINDGVYANDIRYLEPDERYSPNTARAREYAIPRYSLHYEHHFELPDNYTNNLNINLIRDSRYVYDYPHDISGNGETALENRLSVTKNTENAHLSTDISLYQSLIKSDPIGENDTAIHRMPELKYGFLPKNIFNSGLLVGFNANYLNLARANTTFDATRDEKTSGHYRTGQRFIVSPRVIYPLSVGNYLDLLPEINYEELYYQFGYSKKPTAVRRYIRTSIQAKTRLSAILGEEIDPRANRYKHNFEPDLTLTYVPYIEQDNHPFFGKKQNEELNFTSSQPITEYDQIQFDYKDRLVDRQVLTYGLTNKLTRKAYKDTGTEYREIIRHRLAQSYDVFILTQADPLDDEGKVIPVIREPWSEIQSLLSVRLDYFTANSDVSYYVYQNVASSSSSIGFRNKHGDGIAFGYAQRLSTFRDPRTQLPTKRVDTSTRSEAMNLTVYFISKYLDVSATQNFDINSHSFTTQTIGGLLKPPGKCWGIQFTYEKNLGGGNPRYMIQLPIFFGEGKQTTLSKPSGV
ncbi:MAG: LPS assembly protein LptD [Oligoflexia bacterium]|nr:LPS assembly protein LptD [Oligoflexia bacterium]